MSFPSDEYGIFMKLLIKWNLSNTCTTEILRFAKKISDDNIILPTSVKQGHQFLDQIAILHISFKKVPIVIYKEETYYLNYHSIFDAIKELLSNEDIFKHCIFKFTPLYYKGERIYHEQYNREWWEWVEKTIPDTANILSVIIYLDATTCNHFGKSNEHPIYLTLGNIPGWWHNKPDSKVLLGYFPLIKTKTIS